MTAALLGAVCASPFLFGCVEPWSRGLLELAIFALTAVQLARAPFAWRRVPPHAWGIFAVAGLAAVQARAPLSALAAAGGPATSSAWASAATARLWAAYGCLAWLAAVELRSRRRVERAAWALVAAGTAVAVIGIVQKGSGADAFYGLRSIPGRFTVFGPYFYKNHAGGLLAMTCALTAGLLLARAAAYAGGRTIGELANFWSSQALFGAALAVQGVGIWMSGSRGAFHSLAGGAAAVSVLAILGFAGRLRRARWTVALLVGVAAYAAFVVSFPHLVDAEEGKLAGSLLARVRIWESAWAMLRARPWWGFGLGTFEYAYPPLHGALSEIGVVEHAHAEWLELLCTGGVVAVVLYGAGLLVQLAFAVRAWWRWQEPPMRRLLGGALAAAFVFIVHGLAELNFQSPANAAVFLVVSVLVFAPQRRGAAEEGERVPQHAAGWPGRVLGLVLALGGLNGTVRELGGWWCAHEAVEADLPARVRLYTTALHRVPGHPGYARELGVALLWLGEETPAARRAFARQAILAADRGLAGTPDHAGLLEVKGTAVWWLGRREEGKALLARARALRPWLDPRASWASVRVRPARTR